MAQVVGIHGILNQYKGTESLEAEWAPALRDGLRAAGVEDEEARSLSVRCAFYGDAFRRDPHKGVLGQEEVRDLEADGFEAELLRALWIAAAEASPGIAGPGDATKGIMPRWMQSAANAVMRHSLAHLPPGVAERLLVFGLRQVRQYLSDHEVRALAQQRLRDAIEEDTRVIVAHSLGSVIAYETLFTMSEERKIPCLVTLGSPLGAHALIFERLTPKPRDDKGEFPPVDAWFNIADPTDVVALRKNLNACFHGEVRDALVDNGWKSAHRVTHYLSSRQCGEAILHGLG